jgi:HK97 family phage portal protein
MRKGFLAFAGSSFRNLAPVPYTSPGQRNGAMHGLFSRPSGMEAQMRAMGANGTLFAIVDRIITSYSQVEWHLYRKAASGKKEDRREVTLHAALDLLNKPNGFMTGPAFFEAAQQHEELTGEQWWVCSKVHASTMPLELWPVRPDRMRPVTDPEKFCVGYEYVGPSGEIVPLGLDEVIFQRRPNPLDPYRGMGPVQTVLTDLDASRFSREWNRNFFINSAEPGGLLTVEKRLSDEEFNELRARWSEQHKGVTGAHRVAILENGVTWVDRKYSMNDMQFVELAQQSRDTIREAFGFPKPMLGAVDDVNRANADAAEVVFARWLIVPRLRRTRAILNTVLLPMYGPGAKRLEFDYDNPVPDDVDAEAALLTARSAAAAVMRGAGWNPEDILKTVGLPPMRYEAPASVEAPSEPSMAPPAARTATTWDDAVAGLVEPENAMRWVAVAKDDKDTCAPCAENDGHLYRNRADAYADYPGGTGYVNCIGEKYGNQCRCVVVKRRKGNDGKEEG